jgi:ADP-heptose:LPS heptosyltransferase
VVGQKKRVRLLDIRKHLVYRKLNAFIRPNKITKKQQAGELPTPHVSSIYADWFHQLFNLVIPGPERYPYVDIPEKWRDYARRRFADWGFNDSTRVIFLNGFAKSRERNWPLQRVFELAAAMQHQARWRHTYFIINAVPERMSEAKSLFAKHRLERVQLFSGDENFFLLPAILSLCRLIISVDTVFTHLANAVHVPVIALMLQTNPEWVPINAAITTVVRTSRRKAWIEEITVPQVLEALSRWHDPTIIEPAPCVA